MWKKFTKVIKTAQGSLINLTTILHTAWMGYFLLGEKVLYTTWIGAVCILVAAAMLFTSKRVTGDQNIIRQLPEVEADETTKSTCVE